MYTICMPSVGLQTTVETLTYGPVGSQTAGGILTYEYTRVKISAALAHFQLDISWRQGNEGETVGTIRLPGTTRQQV